MEEKTSVKDRYLVIVSALIILLCLIPLLSDEVFTYIFESRGRHSDAVEIGEIGYGENDVRHKTSDSITWKKATLAQSVHLGDSVFTGDNSTTTVKLKDGSKVKLGHNSLLSFTRVMSEDIANLDMGEFKVSVNGKLKIVIGGKVSELEGRGSEVQILQNSKGNAKFRLVKGQVKVKVQSEKSVELSMNKVTSIETIVAKAAEPVESPAPEIMLPQSIETKFYVDHFFDFYEVNLGRVSLRSSRRTFVKMPTEVTWTWKGEPNLNQNTHLQLSNEPDFMTVAAFATVPSRETKAKFEEVYLGNNFFRIAQQSEDWKTTGMFTVKNISLSESPPALSLNPKDIIYLLDASMDYIFKARIDSNSGIAKYILEISNTAQFSPSSTVVVIGGVGGVKYKIDREQIIYLRTRGINLQGQLTAYSNPVAVQVEQPRLPLVPILGKKEFEIYESDKITLNWKNEDVQTKIDVFDLANKLLDSKNLRGASTDLQFAKAGVYKIRLSGVDRFSRVSKLAAQVRINVIPKPVPKLAEVDEKTRKPSSADEGVGQSISKSDLQVPEYLNANYDQSHIILEGTDTANFSQDQLTEGVGASETLAMGFRWMKWFATSDNGLEISFRNKVASINTNNSESISPMKAEVTYHLRKQLSFSPISKLGSSQLALLLGYEYYRNTSSRLFAPKYDLFKTGLEYNLPMLSRWDAGLDLLYGIGSDNSKKYEFSAQLSYYLKKDLSVGAGYRVHIFDAGSLATAPGTLPFREGVAEGYSIFKWSYQ